MDRLTRLLLDAQQGDEGALRQFVAETHHDVRTLCRYLGDADNHDDLAQETYERAIASLHRYRADGPAKHWLLTIARRTCVDATRRRTRRRRLSRRVVELAHDDVASEPIDGIRAEWAELLAALHPDRRDAFVTTQLLGLRYDEAAEVLGVPVGTIRSRVSRARHDLVVALAATEGAGPASTADGEPEHRSRRPGTR